MPPLNTGCIVWRQTPRPARLIRTRGPQLGFRFAMTEPMLKFVSRDRQTPEKRAAQLRRQDFGEIYARYSEQAAADQAARCSQCGVPFCQNHCPLGNNIPDWLRLVAEGRTREAYAVSSATNSMPEICGRICPQDRL